MCHLDAVRNKQNLHVTAKFVASVNSSFPKPDHCLVILPMGCVLAPLVKISKGKSQVQQGPGQTQQGPLIVKISEPAASWME